MTCTTDLYLPPSGDFAQTVAMTDETGAAMDLTGNTASIVDVTGDLGAAVTATITDEAAGLVMLSVAWQGAWAVTEGLLGTFRLSLVNGTAETVTAPTTVYVQGTALQLVIARGCDMAYPFTWPDDRDGADLAGETLDVVNASATLAPLLSVAVTDAAARAYEIRLEGDLSVPLGDAGTFQVRRSTAGANRRTTPPMKVIFA